MNHLESKKYLKSDYPCSKAEAGYVLIVASQVKDKTIIIVEDDSSIQGALVSYFGARNKVHGFGSAEDLLAAELSGITPDLYIIDYKLPGKNGVELFQQLRKTYPGAKYILITGEMNYDVAERTREIGPDALILKPFDFHILEDNISGLVSEAS